MSDFQDPHDLRPAPRQASTPVLWLMATVVLAGTTWLAWPGVAPQASAAPIAASASLLPLSVAVAQPVSMAALQAQLAGSTPR